MNTAFLFPGQGSQSVGMGKDLCENFPVARQVFEEASDALSSNVSRLCFSGPESELNRTENTQPAVLTASVAALMVFVSESDIRPIVVAGHSLGEYTALVASGAIGLVDAVRLVRDRGRFCQEAVSEGEGAMAAVIGWKAEAVEKVVKEISAETGRVVAPANYNGPEQVVISGHADAVKAAVVRAQEKGAERSVFLNVSAPFHSPLMKPAADRLAKKLAEAHFKDAVIPVIANVDAITYQQPEKAREKLERQVYSPVLWTQSMRKLLEMEVELAFEIGPGKVLTRLLRKINREMQCIPVGDIDGIKKALAMHI